MRIHLVAVLVLAVLAGCRTRGEPPPEAPPPAAPPPVLAPTVTRGEFTLHADKHDTWNAVGQIVVRTPGVEYQGRAQMLDLYALRYRVVEFFVLNKALPAAQTGNRITTKVTATTPAGKPVDATAVADLLERLQRELPAEIESVRARQAAEKRAADEAKAKKAKKGKKSKS